jgi:hypothetical protein
MRWTKAMKRVFIAVLLFNVLLAGKAMGKPAVRPFESDADPLPQSRIDEMVLSKLKQLHIAPAKLCSDAVFLRRAYLDLIGTLPTAEEAATFLKDTDPKKRAALVDRLLEREEFADYRALKWCDLLRVKSEFPINLWPNAVQTYHRWIRTCVKENVPYDKFVREMLTASGSNFRVPPVNFYRAIQSREPQVIAQAVALTFMGARAEKWPKEQLAGMASFFSEIGYKHTIEWKEEIVQFDLEKAGTETAAKALQGAVLPDGIRVQLSPRQDPREAFADWLISPKNPWFARNICNRVWSWLLGRGIVHEPDDIRADNPPSNPELLAYLEQELVATHYDLKHFYRLILNSQTYQLSHIPTIDDPQAEANFASYPPRRLEAEVLIDALCQITGTVEHYASMVPEPYTIIPQEQRSIALADASITSGFLEKFGRSPRDNGLESERNTRPTSSQQLHLLNSSQIRKKIEQGPKLQALLQSNVNRQEVATRLYLTILSRFPTEDELQVLDAYGQSGSGKRPGQALVDLAWALLNSPEFSYRH